MQSQSIVANPFALMMDPQAVLDAVERSERLGGLQRRVCRPLDKPLIPKADGTGDASGESTGTEVEGDGTDDLITGFGLTKF